MMAERSAVAQKTLRNSSAMIDDAALASSLSSRICHDLASPIGALGNGVEFLSGRVDDATREHATKVIEDSVRQAAARLAFYRAAFGMGGSLGENARLSELRDMTAAILQGGRVQLDWETGEEEIARGPMRVMLNLVLLGAESLPRGGESLRLRAAGVDQQGGGNVKRRLCNLLLLHALHPSLACSL